MDEPHKQTTAIPNERLAAIPCGSCDRETRHKVLAETFLHWQYADGEVDVWNTYQIIQCQGCLTISFCEASSCSENLELIRKLYLPPRAPCETR